MTSLLNRANRLLAEVAADEWGSVAVSLYDTARLITQAPWLAGHHARVDYLCDTQGHDGGWGQPDGYRLVPTLAATAALMTHQRTQTTIAPPTRVAAATAAGLDALRRWLHPANHLTVADTIGVEIIVPALTDEINALLADAPDLSPPLPLPDGFDHGILTALRERSRRGTLSQRAWACLEVLHMTPQAPGVQPVGGAVAASAAATAAWVGGPDGDPTAVDFLHRLQARGGGPVPGVTPISYFEPAWILNTFAAAGLQATVPATVLDRLEAGLDPTGAPAAPGLPADADDTAAVLAALLRHGRIHAPDALLRYHTGDHFACFLDERNPSVSTNAHVLETLALYLRERPADGARFAGPATDAADWLIHQQQPDGSWEDKWHASRYYATACTALALALHAAPTTHRALERATAWVLDTQREDGSWGRWTGTVEETAYAVHTLLHARPDGTVQLAVKRACAYLTGAAPGHHPPLWHAKDLYTPVAVVHAAQLAALHIGEHITGA
ncbi:prenyltransferase/squalene oxidase repeat-containing protein [Catellatospora chokoriensis]|uniref:Type B diterpene cyclase n=1 Tax=Catellatospora chokoriensis TaxID=310353 RepID=A0A8J3K6A7_9ACTN|nr:prenyltransferase/squalene oxidase repeat-containing protein [Catellatospora chokoriensis]GIF93622.1 type B diterpene cyclase [Catellatospora chokoriensis]